MSCKVKSTIYIIVKICHNFNSNMRFKISTCSVTGGIKSLQERGKKEQYILLNDFSIKIL